MRGKQGLLRFREREHGFNDEQIDANTGAARRERFPLLRERGVRFLTGHLAERLHFDAERADRACDEGVHRLFLLQLRRGFPCQAHSCPVNRFHLRVKPEPLHAKAVRAKGIGLDQFGPGQQVLFMDAAHQVRLRQVQLVVAAVDKDTAVVKHGTHGPVAKHRALAKNCLQPVRH